MKIKASVIQDKIAEKSFPERRNAVRAAHAARTTDRREPYKNGQVSELESDSAWDNFDRYFKFYN